MSLEKLVTFFELDRPKAANAFDLASAQKLNQALGDAVAQKKLGFIITSLHPKIFCSGGDLRNYAALKTKAQGVKMNMTIRKILNSMALAPLYIIAAVDGDCIGGGCELALACDRIVTSDSARFAFKQAVLGVTPGWGGASRLLRRVGPSSALDWLTSGAWIRAREALEHGLTDEIAGADGGPAKNNALEFMRKRLESNPNLDAALLGKIKRLVREEGASENKIFDSLWHSKSHLAAMAEKLRAISERI